MPGSGPLLYLASAFDELTVRRGKLIPGGPNEEEKKGSIPGEQDPIGTSARESDPGRPKVRCSLRMGVGDTLVGKNSYIGVKNHESAGLGHHHPDTLDPDLVFGEIVENVLRNGILATELITCYPHSVILGARG